MPKEVNDRRTEEGSDELNPQSTNPSSEDTEFKIVKERTRIRKKSTIDGITITELDSTMIVET